MASTSMNMTTGMGEPASGSRSSMDYEMERFAAQVIGQTAESGNYDITQTLNSASRSARGPRR